MKTYSAKPTDVSRQWYVVDASQAPLGRLATQVATLLTGKGKPQFTHHIDTGDFVIVVNTDKLVVTGNKSQTKQYYRHSGYPGGLKQSSLAKLAETDSTQIVIKAVRGMLPVNKLRDARLARLKVYAKADHQHQAQQPSIFNLKNNIIVKNAKKGAA